MVPDSYHAFVRSVLSGSEGVYFSVKNKIAGHKTYRGTGLKQSADFEAGPFPMFSLHDFTGKNHYGWSFENFTVEESVISKGFVKNLEDYNPDFELGDLTTLTGESALSFTKKINQLQAKAKAGEFWVANFTQNLSGKLPAHLDPKWLVLKGFYEFLKTGKNHCGGVVITNEQIFCSFSPETFLVQEGPEVRTFPIKGTGSKEALLSSKKEKAELSMITDLMRNDLGQICKQVWVARERYLTEEHNFYHARSEICGHLANNGTLSHEAYKKLLPAGSISGAPKARVLALLKDLESFDRQFYTGTFGVRVNPDKSIFNILIRTLFLDEKNKSWSFPVGAGITIESNPEAEWEETLQKARVLKDCLKS